MKITELPDATTPLAGTEVVPVVQGDATKKVPASAFGPDPTAWTAYTPTVTAGSGTITTVAATGRYKRIGKTVFVHIRVNITTNGNGATSVNVSLPFARVTTNTGDQTTLNGRETAAVGTALSAIINSGASIAMIVRTSDVTYPGGNNYVLQVNGMYEGA